MPVTPEQIFRALADRTRLLSLALLRDEGSLCVCELVEALAQSQPHVSRHLAQLRELELVTDQRRGQWVHYSLNPDLPAWVQATLAAAVSAPSLARARTAAHRRLAGMASRPSLACA